MKFSKILMATAVVLAMVPAAQAETRMTLAHVANVDHPVHKAAETFARVASEESGGDLNIRVFPSSQMGKAKEVLEGIQQGTVDISVDGITSLSAFHPLAGIESMPYLFRDADHYFSLWNSEQGQRIKDLIAEEANFRVLGHMYRGSRELTSNKPISSAADLEGLKIRVTPIKERLETWKAFGANPTPMAWSEVFTSLQQGVIDAQENPLAAIYSEKIYEVQKYLVLTSHMSNGFTFVFNAKRYEAMPDKHKAALEKAAAAASKQFNDFVSSSYDQMVENLRAEGMEIVEIDTEPLRAKAKDVVALFPELESYYLALTQQ